jgi:Mrp family chromosome partitioning ATPase
VTSQPTHRLPSAGTRQPRVVSQLDSEEPPPVTILSFPDEDDPEHSAVEALFPRIDWHKLWADETTEEWIVEPLIPARRLVALFSAPKVGKSLLMLELAAAIARGASVLGQPPQPPRRVLYVDFENDPRGDIRTRLKNMGLTPDDLDNLVYLS